MTKVGRSIVKTVARVVFRDRGYYAGNAAADQSDVRFFAAICTLRPVDDD